MSDEFDINDIDPGVRKAVMFLRNNGFETTDSGDGKAKFMDGDEHECVLPFPNIAILVEPEQLIFEAKRLMGLLVAHKIPVEQTGNPIEDNRVAIQASYDPADEIAVIVVFHLDDSVLPEPKEVPHGPEQCSFCATMARD